MIGSPLLACLASATCLAAVYGAYRTCRGARDDILEKRFACMPVGILAEIGELDTAALPGQL